MCRLNAVGADDLRPKKKDVSGLRRLEIKSFFNAQTSMEIFRSELMGLFSVRTDVSHFARQRFYGLLRLMITS